MTNINKKPFSSSNAGMSSELDDHLRKGKEPATRSLSKSPSPDMSDNIESSDQSQAKLSSREKISVAYDRYKPLHQSSSGEKQLGVSLKSGRIPAQDKKPASGTSRSRANSFSERARSSETRADSQKSANKSFPAPHATNFILDHNAARQLEIDARRQAGIEATLKKKVEKEKQAHLDRAIPSTALQAVLDRAPNLYEKISHDDQVEFPKEAFDWHLQNREKAVFLSREHGKRNPNGGWPLIEGTAEEQRLKGIGEIIGVLNHPDLDVERREDRRGNDLIRFRAPHPSQEIQNGIANAGRGAMYGRNGLTHLINEIRPDDVLEAETSAFNKMMSERLKLKNQDLLEKSLESSKEDKQGD